MLLYPTSWGFAGDHPCSALLLLVFGVLADDHHMALALDDLALFANGFNRGTNLHAVFLHSYGQRKRPIGMPVNPCCAT